MYEDFDCPLNLLDSHKVILGACIVILGIGGVLLNAWVMITFIHSHLLSFKSHLLVLNLCTACLARNILGGFTFAGPSALAGRWIFGQQCCKLFAFMQQLLGVFQMISLAVLCFERFLITKRLKREKQDLSIKFYMASIVFCWSYSITFSIPPLLQYGDFGCDASGTTCTLEWRYRNIRQTSFNILLVIFAGIIPIVCIGVSLWKCVRLNRRQRLSDTQWEQWSLTKVTVSNYTTSLFRLDNRKTTTAFNTCIVAVTILIFWLPQAVLASWVSITSWSKALRYSGPSFAISILAPLGAEAATLIPVLCYMAGEPRIRTALLGRCKENYGIIKRRRESSGFTMISET
ncbi:rhodopsin, GQ-coupled-like [Arctopsyche grandis]|uniref:rhodopsin, GQ-coupled-like n=1 Tax=Arctopsyche grandis TaxID=121162 RepID=UPI00406D77EB